MDKLTPSEYAEFTGKLLELRKEYGDLVLKIGLFRPDETDKEILRQIHSLEASIIHPSEGLIVRSNKNTERINSLKKIHFRDVSKIEKKIEDLNKNIEISELLKFKTNVTKFFWILISLFISAILTVIGLKIVQ